MKRTFLFYCLLLVLWLPIASCDVAPPPTLPENASAPVAREEGEGAGEQTGPASLHLSARHAPHLPTPGLQVIRQAQVEFQVEDYGRSSTAIEAAVSAHGGYIERGNESRSGQRLENLISIRVPASRFESLLSSLLFQSHYLVEKTITATEVGEEMVDLNARLQSTITLRYYEQIPAVSPPDESFFFRLAEALGEGWKFLGVTVIGLAYLWPFLLLGLLAWGGMHLQASRKKAVSSGPFPPVS